MCQVFIHQAHYKNSYPGIDLLLKNGNANPVRENHALDYATNFLYPLCCRE